MPERSRHLISGAAEASRRACARCGTCCEKGGPGLHLADRGLIESGAIPLRDLYTLREGELALDNVRGGLSPLAGDVIRIRERPGSSACFHHDPAAGGCRIYGSRPAECRALACWDTRRITALYDRDRLSRRDLLAGVSDLWELVAEHQRQCDPRRAVALVAALGAGGQSPAPASEPAPERRELSEMIAYDGHLRQLAAERGRAPADAMDFLFGRPLEDALRPVAGRWKNILSPGFKR